MTNPAAQPATGRDDDTAERLDVGLPGELPPAEERSSGDARLGGVCLEASLAVQCSAPFIRISDQP
jgi:hypothetical protein